MLRAALAPASPRPRLGLLGSESPGDPACIGRLPTAVEQRFAGGWLGSPALPPPPCGLPAGCPPVPLPPPWGGGSASDAGGDAVVGVLPSAGPRPVAGEWGGEGGAAAVPSWSGGRKAEGGAEELLLSPRSGSGGSGGAGGILWLCPPLCVLCCLVALPLVLGSVPKVAETAFILAPRAQVSLLLARSRGNNTYCCSDKGVARQGGGVNQGTQSAQANHMADQL